MGRHADTDGLAAYPFNLTSGVTWINRLVFDHHMLLHGSAGHFSAGRHFAFETVSRYWHFVDFIWLCLFVFVYWLCTGARLRFPGPLLRRGPLTSINTPQERLACSDTSI